MIAIVKEVQFQTRRDENRADLTLFPNGEKRMMYRDTHMYPVIEVQGRNRLGKLTQPLRGTIHHKRKHDHWSASVCRPSKPKLFKTNCPEQAYEDVCEGYLDANDCLQYDEEWHQGCDGW
jgi:hypothetical protein